MTEAGGAAEAPAAAPDPLAPPALACSRGGIVEQYSNGLFGLGDRADVKLVALLAAASGAAPPVVDSANVLAFVPAALLPPATCSARSNLQQKWKKLFHPQELLMNSIRRM